MIPFQFLRCTQTQLSFRHPHKFEPGFSQNALLLKDLQYIILIVNFQSFTLFPLLDFEIKKKESNYKHVTVTNEL